MALNYHYCASRAKPMRTKSPINVRWNKLEMNWYKLNIDESAMGNSSKAGGGALKICSSLNLLAVEIELDVKVVMDWVSGNTTKIIAHFALISDCRQLMGQIPNQKVKHYYREANQCTNKLAKMVTTQQQDFLLFSNPLLDIMLLMLYDSAGVCYERLCLNSSNLS
ncbi:uncharacterized protein LOC142639928 [Castanea sativa]|uniref:uncharacterized protein LOC142639928 n=1 Tax=Castanea sativa TaxID=21020 RepID=UPI003F650CE2